MGQRYRGDVSGKSRGEIATVSLLDSHSPVDRRSSGDSFCLVICQKHGLFFSSHNSCHLWAWNHHRATGQLQSQNRGVALILKDSSSPVVRNLLCANRAFGYPAFRYVDAIFYRKAWGQKSFQHFLPFRPRRKRDSG